MKTAILNMRIDADLKEQAEELYNGFGITITDAVNMFLTKSVMENGLPFELKRYNKATEATMSDAKQIAADIKAGKRKGHDSSDALFKSLGI